MILGKPKYSLKFLTTTNNRKAVRRAPKLSIRNSFLGCLTDFINIFFQGIQIIKTLFILTYLYFKKTLFADNVYNEIFS